MQSSARGRSYFRLDELGELLEPRELDKAVLQSIHKCPFLIQRRDVKQQELRVEFSHRSFLEYFTARGVAKALEQEPPDPGPFNELVLNVDMRKFLRDLVGEERFCHYARLTWGLGDEAGGWKLEDPELRPRLEEIHGRLLAAMTEPGSLGENDLDQAIELLKEPGIDPRQPHLPRGVEDVLRPFVCFPAAPGDGAPRSSRSRYDDQVVLLLVEEVLEQEVADHHQDLLSGRYLPAPDLLDQILDRVPDPPPPPGEELLAEDGQRAAVDRALLLQAVEGRPATAPRQTGGGSPGGGVPSRPGHPQPRLPTDGGGGPLRHHRWRSAYRPLRDRFSRLLHQRLERLLDSLGGPAPGPAVKNRLLLVDRALDIGASFGFGWMDGYLGDERIQRLAESTPERTEDEALIGRINQRLETYRELWR